MNVCLRSNNFIPRAIFFKARLAMFEWSNTYSPELLLFSSCKKVKQWNPCQDNGWRMKDILFNNYRELHGRGHTVLRNSALNSLASCFLIKVRTAWTASGSATSIKSITSPSPGKVIAFATNSYKIKSLFQSAFI